MSRGEQRYNWELCEGDIIRAMPSRRLVMVLGVVKEYTYNGKHMVRCRVKTVSMPLGDWIEEMEADRRHKVFNLSAGE